MSITLSGRDKLSVVLVSVVFRPWLLLRLTNNPIPNKASKSTIGTVTPTMIAVLSLSTSEEDILKIIKKEKKKNLLNINTITPPDNYLEFFYSHPNYKFLSKEVISAHLTCQQQSLDRHVHEITRHVFSKLPTPRLNRETKRMLGINAHSKRRKGESFNGGK